MALRFTTSHLENSFALFRYYKKLGDGAMTQVEDQQLFGVVGPDMNSIAVIVQHLSGNMVSRWSNFLSSDGEKAGRNRDAEFEDVPDAKRTRANILEMWETGWTCLFGALESLTQEDEDRAITIRGESHSVMQAINR